MPVDEEAAALGVGGLSAEEELVARKAKHVGFFGHLHKMFGGGTP